MKLILTTDESDATLEVDDRHFRAAIINIGDGLTKLLSFSHGLEAAVPKLTKGKFPVRRRGYQIKA